MKFTDELKDFAMSRYGIISTCPVRAIYVKEYTKAVGRIQDHTADESNPYWVSTDEEFSAMPHEENILDEFGAETSPADIRKRAFEMLVLADLAEMS